MTHSKPEQMKADIYIQLTISYFVQLFETGQCGTFILLYSCSCCFLPSLQHPVTCQTQQDIHFVLCSEMALRARDLCHLFSNTFIPKQQAFAIQVMKNRIVVGSVLLVSCSPQKNKVLDSLPPLNIYIYIAVDTLQQFQQCRSVGAQWKTRINILTRESKQRARVPGPYCSFAALPYKVRETTHLPRLVLPHHLKVSARLPEISYYFQITVPHQFLPAV